MFFSVTHAHENSEQHAIVHVYTLLESEYMKAEEKNCKMSLLERPNCKSSSSNNKKDINQ